MQLTPIQTTILDTIRTLSSDINRSELAKLLVGSASERTVHLQSHASFGALKKYSRKSVMQDIDILIQQGLVSVSAENKLTTTDS